MKTVTAWWSALLDAEAERFVLWLPVFMGAGVLGYDALRFEPAFWVGAAAIVPLVVVLGAIPRARGLCAPILASALGFSSAQIATARAPPLEIGLPTHAVVLSGTVRMVEILPNGRRVTVEFARLDGAPPLLRRVRVRLRATDAGPLATGDTIRVRAIVRPPSPPSYPGGWDLQKDAFFAGLGASGYALGPAERLTEAIPSGPARFVQWLRETIAARVTTVIPGAAGTVCVTLLTGGQTSIPPAEHQAAFRDSGLAHLLAVAGLHIGIVMGFAMGATRLAFACSMRASLYWPTKKLAAIAALATGGFYMVLTGMHVPIVRSFCMACLFTLGVIAGRRAISLRGLGLAGVALMLIAPQEVGGVSFQMSFSAVLALIAGYEALRPWLRKLHGKSWPRRLGSHIVALGLTSALAGTFSAPYGAYHFGHIQLYFIIANMVAVPLTAIWVMPAGLIALALMPFGLEALALVPMGWGAEAIVWVATTTASWPAATLAVPHMPPWGLAVFSLGLAWVGIWRSRPRLLGLLPMLIGILSPIADTPPDVLVSADARLIGMRTPAGIYLQQRQGGSAFVRDAWLQFWMRSEAVPFPSGDVAGCTKDACLLRARADAKGVLLVRGPSRPGGCSETSVIVSAEPARGLCPRPWPQLVDRFTVWRNGATAIWLTQKGAVVVTDRMARGDRPWVPPPPKPRPKKPPTLPPAATDRVSAAGP